MFDETLILDVKNKEEFREWLIENSNSKNECYIYLKRGEPKDDKIFYYLDAVEVALCFGWIDSTLKNIDGIHYQRFSKRDKNSHWSYLNIERCKRLIKLNLMTNDGISVMPKDEFIEDEKIIDDIKKEGLLEIFREFPILYQRIRIDNLSSTLKRSKEEYSKAFSSFVKYTKNKKMYGSWNDYGRLL